MYGLSDEQTRFFIRLSWMRFFGLNFSRPVLDETRFCRNSDQGRRGFVSPCDLARTGLSRPELVDAVGAPRQRTNEEEKEAIKSGKMADLAQQSRSCSKGYQCSSNTVKPNRTSKAKSWSIRLFPYQGHINLDHPKMDSGSCNLRTCPTRRIPLMPTAFRKNEAMLTSQIHRKTPEGTPMPNSERIIESQGLLPVCPPQRSDEPLRENRSGQKHTSGWQTLPAI